MKLLIRANVSIVGVHIRGSFHSVFIGTDGTLKEGFSEQCCYVVNL